MIQFNFETFLSWVSTIIHEFHIHSTSKVLQVHFKTWQIISTASTEGKTFRIKGGSSIHNSSVPHDAIFQFIIIIIIIKLYSKLAYK